MPRSHKDAPRDAQRSLFQKQWIWEEKKEKTEEDEEEVEKP